MEKYGFGVDVGGTTVKIGLFEAGGKLVDKWEIPTVTDNNGEQIFIDIAKAINEKLSEKGIDKTAVIGVGMGVPGPVTNESYVVQAVNLGWKDLDVSGKLFELVELPVKVTNDANAAVLGEMWQGNGRLYRSWRRDWSYVCELSGN